MIKTENEIKHFGKTKQSIGYSFSFPQILSIFHRKINTSPMMTARYFL